MLSWLHFATFGNVYAGGWAKKDALYCIVPRFRDELHTDAFYVSFLKHETQHLRDYQEFPQLKAPDLEYRAKLVEIMYYSDHEFFNTLLIQAVKNKNSPHNYAAYKITEQFSKHFFNKDEEKQIDQWQTINYEDIQSYARKLFDEHTILLKSKGARTIEGVI